MKRNTRRYLIFAGIAVFLAAGYFFRERIKGLLFKRKTVAMVTDELKERRERDFLAAFPDLYQIKAVRLIAVKQTRKLEVWTRNDEEPRFRYRKTYDFTGFSGTLGPKLRAGDKQIPEGVYDIEGLNPNSAFHLSIRIGYPSDSDQKLALVDGRTDLGGDILIHGKSSTIGCIPIGDNNIEELFYLIAQVKPRQSHIVIMPVDFRRKEYRAYAGKTPVEKEIYGIIRREIR